MPTKITARLASVRLGRQPTGDTNGKTCDEETTQGGTDLSGVKRHPIRRAGPPAKRRKQPNHSQCGGTACGSSCEHGANGSGSAQIPAGQCQQTAGRGRSAASTVEAKRKGSLARCPVCSVIINEEGVSALFPFHKWKRPKWLVGLCELHTYQFLIPYNPGSIYLCYKHNIEECDPCDVEDEEAVLAEVARQNNVDYRVARKAVPENGRWVDRAFIPPIEEDYTLYLSRWLKTAIKRTNTNKLLIRCENNHTSIYLGKTSITRCKNFASSKFNQDGKTYWICRTCYTNTHKRCNRGQPPKRLNFLGSEEKPLVAFMCVATTPEELTHTLKLHIPKEWKVRVSLPKPRL